MWLSLHLSVTSGTSFVPLILPYSIFPRSSAFFFFKQIYVTPLSTITHTVSLKLLVSQLWPWTSDPPYLSLPSTVITGCTTTPGWSTFWNCNPKNLTRQFIPLSFIENFLRWEEWWYPRRVQRMTIFVSLHKPGPCKALLFMSTDTSAVRSLCFSCILLFHPHPINPQCQSSLPRLFLNLVFLQLELLFSSPGTFLLIFWRPVWLQSSRKLSLAPLHPPPGIVHIPPGLSLTVVLISNHWIVV